MLSVIKHVLYKYPITSNNTENFSRSQLTANDVVEKRIYRSVLKSNKNRE